MTPDELLKLTPQEVFTLAAKHLIKQGRQARGHAVDGCAYRENGNADDKIRCTVGFFIPDSLYFPEIEGLAVKEVVKVLHNTAKENKDENLSKLATFLQRHLRLLDALQRIHDASYNPYCPDMLAPYSSLKSLDSDEFDQHKLRANLMALGVAFNLDTSFLKEDIIDDA